MSINVVDQEEHMMMCTQQIENVLMRMNTTFNTPTQFVTAMNGCIHDLQLLNVSCSDNLLKAGYEVLDHVNESLRYGEPILWIILMALVEHKQPNLLTLLNAALRSEEIQDKEMYISILEDINTPESTTILMDIVRGTFKLIDEDGHLRAKAIHALFYRDNTEVRALIMASMPDPSDRMRNEVLKFLFWREVHEAAPLFVELLRDEDDPYNLELLIKGVDLWHQTDALPVLRELVLTNWVQGDEDLRERIAIAIANLTQLVTDDNVISETNATTNLGHF